MKRNIHHFFQFVLLVTFTYLLVIACSNQIATKGNPRGQFTTSECQVTKHQLGESCIPTNPQRIIVTDETVLDAVVGLGFKPIAAAESNALGSRGPQFGSKIEGIISIGKESLLNLEKIVELQPDLILGLEIGAENYGILSKIAPTVSIQFDETAWKETLQLLGKMLNREAQASQALNLYQQRVENLRTEIAQKHQNTEVSIIRFYGGSPLTQFQNQFSFPVKILEEVGLSIPEAQKKVSNPADSYVLVGLESIELLDADVMFVALDPGSEKNFKRYRDNQIWQLLNVVKNNRIYTVDSGYWIVGNILCANAILDDIYKYLLSIKQ